MSTEKKSNGSSAGIGLCGGVFLVFLILKLAEIGVVASWSWWWVTAPLWMPLALTIVILIIMLIGYIIKESVKAKKRKKQSSAFNERLREAQRMQDDQRKGRWQW